MELGKFCSCYCWSWNWFCRISN